MTQRAITVLLTAITGPYVANMGRAAGATASVGTAAAGAQAKTGMLGGAMGGLTGKLLAGGGLVYGLSKGAQLLMSYEDALVGVGKTTGLTGSELTALGDELTELGKDIRGSAEDMLGIAQSAAQLGIANEDILGFTKTVANLASATDLTVDTAATGMARLANILQMPSDQFENLASSIVRMGNTMATTEPEILNMAQRVASAGRAAGMSEAEIIALSAAASSLGLEAEAGGTALSMTLVKIQEAAITGGAELDTFARMAGMSAQQFAEAWETDPVQALQAFLEGLGQFADQGGNTVEVLDAIGLDGMRVSDTLRRLSGNTELVEDATRGATSAFRDGTDAIEEAAVANATASAEWERLMDTLADFGRTAAGAEEGTEGLADAIRGITGLVEILSDAVGKVEGVLDAEWLNDPFVEIDLNPAEKMAWTLDQVAAAAGATTADVRFLNAATSEFGDGIRFATDAAAGATPAIYGLGDAHLDAAASAKQQLAAGIELADQFREQRDPVFALTQALDGARQAEVDYQDAVEEHGAASQPAEDASWALFEALEAMTDASLRVGPEGFDQAIRRVDALAAANEITAGQADDLKGALHDARLAAEDFSGDYRMSLRVDMPLADQALLNSAQALAGTSGATTTIHVPVGARATGGPVSAGSMYLVGEEGPELFSPGTSGRIVPAGETSKMTLAAAPQPVGRSGGDINLTVHAGMGADGHRIGSEIVGHLLRFKRLNGPLNLG